MNMSTRLRRLTDAEDAVVRPRVEQIERARARLRRTEEEIATEEQGLAALAPILLPAATGVEMDEDGTIYLTRGAQ